MTHQSSKYSSPPPVAAGPSGPAAGSDWTRTIEELIGLAARASEAFDYDQAVEYLRHAESLWNSKQLPEFSIELRIQLHRQLGQAESSLGNLGEAIGEYQKVLEYCRGQEQLSIKSEMFAQIGQLMAKKGEHDRALGYIQRAVNAYRRLRDAAGVCRALRNLGVVYVELGEFDEAVATYEEAIELADGLEDRIIYADLVNNLGAIMNMRGEPKPALELYRESLEIYQSLGEIRKSAYTKNNVAITLLEQGQYSEAQEYFQAVHEIAEQIKDSSLGLIVDINLADLYLSRDNLGQAGLHCERAEKHLVAARLHNGHLVEVQKLAGMIAIRRNDKQTALRYFNEALTLGKKIGAQFLVAQVLHERGLLYRAVDDTFAALKDLEASYQIYRTIRAEGKRKQAQRAIGSIEELYLDIFNAMAVEVDRKDPYTKGHSDRVASLALLLARDLGLKSNELKTIAAGALLHDIGKLQIDDTVLKKAGRLTDDEFAQIKQHPQYGIDLLEGTEFPWDIKPIILLHHEKISGGGYPVGLKGEEIPLGAKIVCIADVFDALTSDRVYRKAFSPEKALSIMNEESGTSFDPVLLERFEALIESGRADLVINSRTREDEMYSIWSSCMDDATEEPAAETAEVTTA